MTLQPLLWNTSLMGNEGIYTPIFEYNNYYIVFKDTLMKTVVFLQAAYTIYIFKYILQSCMTQKVI